MGSAKNRKNTAGKPAPDGSVPEKSSPGPHALLRHLRAIMAEPMIDAQERLDTIVAKIAANMLAEVCSVYVLRADDTLELFASKGLNPVAVHEVSLKVGQGLVGTIGANAKTLNLADAQAHPDFAYLPETGEEIYNSFLGVPILRAGRILGVLVVQNQEQRIYSEDEIEALETTAMVLAELIAAGEVESLVKPGSRLDLSRPVQASGIVLADGIGLGYVVLHEPRVIVTELFNDNFDEEKKRLHKAAEGLRASIDHMLKSGAIAREGEHREVLEAYAMLANDRGWMRRMEECIANGLTAEAAVEKIQSDNRARMRRQSDPYLRERLHDFDDLAHRLLRELVGRPHGPLSDNIERDYIVVARNMGAAELLDYNGEGLRGLVLEEGGPTSHVVIVARALGIPVVGQIADILSIADSGNPVIVDGEEGSVHLRPAEETIEEYSEKISFRAKRRQNYQKLSKKPAISKDDVKVDLLMNAGLLMDLPNVANNGADGIGLFRTELQFMVASKFPRPGEQEALYRSVLEAAGEKPVTFRILDIGGDKVLPYIRSEQEENPALGWRAVRLALDRPGLIRSQIRALLRAADNHDLRLMVPMVTEISEIKKVRQIIEREVELIKRFDHGAPKSLKLGAMIEVPSLLFQLDALMKNVDFVSVGSNDLFQFFCAADRGNARISNRFDALSRPFLRALRQIVIAAKTAKKPVHLCGEMAGKPISALALFGIGFRSISMAGASIGPIKAMVLETEFAKLSEALATELDDPEPTQSIRQFLSDFAVAANIPH